MKARLAAALAAAAALGALVVFAWSVLSPAPAVRSGPLVVEFPPHEGVANIGRQLEDSGAIRSRHAFVAAAALRRSARRLRAGEYEIPRDASTLDVLRLLESGRVRQHVVLHPEGATVLELAQVLQTERLAAAPDVLRVASDPAFLRAYAIEGPSAEGYLFPDTYYFVRGMRVDEMLGRMVQRLHAKVGPDIEARAAQRGLTLHALLTLASIVEREAIVRDEMRLISAVFWNRLKRDMPLQADPTVQYAVGKERRTLTKSDLQTEHPFNTYQRTGLPPGPIASPGLPAIEATLDPAPVPYLYFVAAADHRHHFSTTVSEHNAAVARYRRSRER
jgi:peptidoglycan lytic transglycosylase G